MLHEGNLQERVLTLASGPDEALTAGDVTARLMGGSGGYAQIASPEVRSAQPLIMRILDSFLAEGRLVSLKRTGPSGPEVFYGRPVDGL